MPSAPPTFLPFSFLSNTLTSFTHFLSTKLANTNTTNSPTDSPICTHHHSTHNAGNAHSQLHFTASTASQRHHSHNPIQRVQRYNDQELLAPPPYPHTHSAEPQPGEFVVMNAPSHSSDNCATHNKQTPTPTTSASPLSSFAGMVDTVDLAVNDNYYQQQQLHDNNDDTQTALDDSRSTDDKDSTSNSPNVACCPPSSSGGATATDIMSLVSIVCHSVRRLIRSRRPLILCVGPNAAMYSTFIQHYFALIRGRVLNIHQVRYGEEVSSLLYVGGIVTCADPSLLLEVDEGCFDVCFSFNMSFSSKSAALRFVKLLKRTIKNGGAVAGTGIFVADQQQLLLQQQNQQQQRSHEDEDPGALSPSESFDELDCGENEDDGLHQHEPRVASVQWTLSDLRDIFNSTRFDIHTAIDLTLETNVFYATTPITPTFAQQLIHPAQRRRGSDVYSSLQFRRLPFGAAWCAARFLATKHDELVDPSPVSSRRNSASQHHLPLPSPLKMLALPRRSSFDHRLAKANAVFQDELLSPRSPLRAPTSSPDSSPSSPSLTASQLSADTLSVPSINIEPATSTSTSPISSSSPFASSPMSVTPCPPKPCIVVPGVALMLPRSSSSSSACSTLCDRSEAERLLNGECSIECLSAADKSSIVDMNSFQLVKCGDKRVKKYFNQPEQVVQVCSKVDDFDLVKQYAVPPHVAETLDVTYKMAIAAGLDALADAGINVYGVDEKGQRCIVGLPEEMRDTTGVIFASSFPCLDSCVDEVSKKVRAQTRAECAQQFQQQQQSSDSTSSSSSTSASSSTSHEYEYDRKLLFKLLVMANCQLAELIKARGPNTHVNGACAGTTQALAIASDWITLGRCRTVIVVAADNATGSRVLQYVSTGFLGLGAHTTAASPHIAAKPFDKLRSGMILGAGAVALVLTDGNVALPTSVISSTSSSPSTQLTTTSTTTSSLSVAPVARPKVRIVASQVSNSAFHACLMDKTHIASQLCTFLDQLQREHGLQRDELASQLLYIAHETGTQACAMAECNALKTAFGESFNKLLITNTKGYTGHAMAVAFEDVAAVFCLENSRSVCVPSFEGRQQVDPALGLVDGQLVNSSNMKLTQERRFVLRFAAGFGSQLVYMLFERLSL